MTRSTPEELLRKALHSADWQAVEALIDAHPRADLFSKALPCGQTPLQLASLLGATHIVQRLIELGISRQDAKAHVYAARNGHVNVLRLLLPCSAPHQKIVGCTCDVHSPTAGQALHWAAWHAHEPCVEVILEGLCEGARTMALKWRAENGGTSLHAAALSGNARLVSILLNAGSSVHWKDKDGLRAVDLARRFTVATGKGSEVITLLVEAEENGGKGKIREMGVVECAPCLPRKVRQATGEVCHAI